jgi:hypothetical protein
MRGNMCITAHLSHDPGVQVSTKLLLLVHSCFTPLVCRVCKISNGRFLSGLGFSFAANLWAHMPLRVLNRLSVYQSTQFTIAIYAQTFVGYPVLGHRCRSPAVDEQLLQRALPKGTWCCKSTYQRAMQAHTTCLECMDCLDSRLPHL